MLRLHPTSAGRVSTPRAGVIRALDTGDDPKQTSGYTGRTTVSTPRAGVIRHSPSVPDCSLGLVPARGGDPDTTIITANTQASRPRPRGSVPRHKLADDGTFRRHRRVSLLLAAG